MDGVTNNPFSRQEYIQYKNYTFKNETARIYRVDPADVDMDQFVQVDTSPARQAAVWKGAFSGSALARSSVSEVKKELDAKTADAINGFFDGTVSEEELAGTFQTLAEKFFSACEDAGYPCLLPSLGAKQAMTEAFYSEFRRKILDAAVQRNNAEGQQYITGAMNSQRNWKYYNSDYYFKSEAAISAITGGLERLTQGPAYEGFTLPDYKAEGMELYYNFNSALSCPYAQDGRFLPDGQFLLDPDTVPPENFQWFYQSGGDSVSGEITAKLAAIQYPNGATEFIDYTTPGFDPTDPAKATTWAFYRDAQGSKHLVSANFTYNFSKDDLHNVSKLLSFTQGDPAQDAKVNRFLSNLQVYSKGYWTSRSSPRAINLRA